MEAATFLVDPLASEEALAREEQELRPRYSRLTEPHALPPRNPTDLLEHSVRFLELHLILAATVEANLELGVRTVKDAMREMARVREFVIAVTGLDPIAVVKDNAKILPTTWKPNPDDPVATNLDYALRNAGAILSRCPIARLETIASESGLDSLGHRCRRAYDALEAFVCRNDPRQDSRARVIGRAYAEGRLSLSEVATLLGWTRSDAIAFLERNGYGRSLSKIALPEEQCDKILQAIRADRIRRKGEPEPSPDVVARDVIASQRIEGIDARPWVPRPKK